MKYKLNVVTRSLGIKHFEIVRVCDGVVVLEGLSKKKVVPILNLLNHYKGM